MTVSMPSFSARRVACRGAAPPKAIRVREASVLAPLDCVHAGCVRHVLVHYLAHCERGERGIEVHRLPDVPRQGLLRRWAVQRHAPPRKALGVHTAEHHIGVGDGSAGAAAPVAGRPRLRARTLGPHPDSPETVEVGNGAAPGTDLDHLDHRNAKRQPAALGEAVLAIHLEGARRLGLPAVDETDFGGSASHVEGEDLVDTLLRRETAREDRTPRRSRFHQPDRVPDCGLDGGEAAPGSHHQERSVDAGVLDAPTQVL